MSKNGYRLTSRTRKKGYDWWWHSFVGQQEITGELRPFFIEYYVINPALWKGEIILGQSEINKLNHRPPVYAMIKAGCWGMHKAQIHNFYGIDQFKASKESLDCKIGEAILTENIIKGAVTVSKEQSLNHPDMMSDAGTMSWNLKAKKIISYDVGYGSSNLFNSLNAFKMYWHVEGMVTEFEGEVIFNDEKFKVYPQSSFGYQDKNWGSDYTNPWIWLNCNNFISLIDHQPVKASLDLGGGCPTIFGLPLARKILTAFWYNGELHEFNFSKFWKYSKQKFISREDNEYIYWDITSCNRKLILDIHFKCRKDFLLNVNYENPEGKKYHHKLWNGGHAGGTVKIYRNNRKMTLIDELQGSFGGCEYGEY